MTRFGHDVNSELMIRGQTGVHRAVNLSDLINTRKGELGLSYEKLAGRARVAGHELTGNALFNLTRREIQQYPAPNTIRAVAAALGVEVRAVLDAVDESLGFERVPVDSGASDVQAWITLTGDRTPAERQALLDFVRAKIQELDDGGEADRPGDSGR